MPFPTLKGIRIMYKFQVVRNGEPIYEAKRTRDLCVWIGQKVLAYLISQGAVGTATSTWYVIASSNEDSPDMGDNSGDPEANEFNPQIGTKVEVSYSFEPETKPSSGAQLIAQLHITGTITVGADATLRKIGIIDGVATPNRNIIVEDAVVPIAVLNGDTIPIDYFMYLGV